jgi:two-component system sensor histidine kinase DegS
MIDEEYKRITKLQEYDRKRIASDLHDTSLQTLAHITHQIELTSMYMDKDMLRAKLELADINKELHEVIDEIRNTIFNLRPMTFDDLGLKEAIEREILTLEKKSDIKYRLNISDISIKDDFVKLQVLRIIQECVHNSEKHSQAKNVNIEIFQDDMLHILFEDDGIGMDMEEIPDINDNHFGLAIIRDRVNMINGNINIESTRDNGTKITFTVSVD